VFRRRPRQGYASRLAPRVKGYVCDDLKTALHAGASIQATAECCYPLPHPLQPGPFFRGHEVGRSGQQGAIVDHHDFEAICEAPQANLDPAGVAMS